jgi:thioredoxin reductase (NADPH)
VAKPVILTVDDDPQVLSAVRRDLRSKYAADYRIVSAPTGADAVAAAEQLKGRGDAIALFLVDQRMPQMEGTDLLVQVSPLFPNAKRVLLTAYADTEAAIQAINEVDLDFYLMKPWDPPEDNLYPVLDDLLADWAANVPASFDGVRVAGTTWSPHTHDVKEFLALNHVPYRFLDIERDADASAMVAAAADGDPKVPVIFFPDGNTLVQPDRRLLAETIGLRVAATNPFYDVIIIGGGPAGLAAAVYGASEGLKTAMVEREAPGGQAGTSSRIENYLGFPAGISGSDLARRAVAQATRLGAEIISAEVDSVRVEDPVKVVTLADETELSCHALLIASGMTLRKLSVPGYERFEGAGVYYGAAPSEAATYQDGEVYVIGGANSAGQAAMMFSKFAAKVTMIVRGPALELKMSQYLVDQISDRENIEVLVNTRVMEVTGEDRIETIKLRDLSTDTDIERPANAIFIFVGAVPHSDFVEGVVARNDRGFVMTGPDVFVEGKRPSTWNLDRDPMPMETSVPGIFAAGDVRHGVVRRVASAVGQGSVAISMIHQYLETV